MTVEKSGFYYPNKIVRIYIKNIEKTIGSAAMEVVYDLANIPLTDRPPPNNYAKEFDFANFAAINTALGKMYGPRGERGLTTHAGRAAFTDGLAEFASVLGVGDLALKAIPTQAKVRIGLKAIAETFNKFTDITVEIQEADDYFIYVNHRCPVCWGRKSDYPVCYSSISLIEAGLSWVSNGKKFRIEEVACFATGDQTCTFHIWKEPIG
jgi:predicted hydrocarbon binding protein